MVMLLAGPSATLRGKLTEKVKYRPTAKIAPLLPAGTDTLESLVKLRPALCLSASWFDRSRRRRRWRSTASKAIRRTAAVFARNHHKVGTLAEHDKYVVWVNVWMQLSGFGDFVVVDEKVCRDVGTARA